MNPSPPLPARTLTLDALAGKRGERLLFKDLSLALGVGEIAELRGSNGAGKTTLLMILAGVVHPAAGTVRIGGGDPDERPELALALLAHRPAIKARLTVAENLRFWATLNGDVTGAIEDALTQVGLAAIARLDAGYLSAGQTRRLALARLLLANRPIWLLDEPTAALDADGEQLVAGLIDAHLDRGGLAVAATHHGLGLRHPVRSVQVGA